MSKIDISLMDKADVLAALYNESQPLGLGRLHYTPELMTKEEAENLLKKSQYFDYLKGRIMKINLDNDDGMLFTGLYDRDNGPGAAEAALRKHGVLK